MTEYIEYFTVEELRDPTTGEVKLQPGFADLLIRLRQDYSYPMPVTSGCRSMEHNRRLIRNGLPAHPTSLHLIDNPLHGTDCCAVDVRRPAGTLLFKLTQAAIARGWSIGIAKTFVHLDQRGTYTNLPAVLYTY